MIVLNRILFFAGLWFLSSFGLEWSNSTSASFSDEICDNAIDDDGDGLIDLNDEDCNCPVARPVSLIPNPSFEMRSCCPQNFSELHCADTWVQASEATTDYLNTCGFSGWDNLPPPLPVPDGEAYIGFRDGRPPFTGDEQANPNWKEYTGACLTSPLRANVRYRFDFFIGFINPTNSPPANIVFYGTPDCEHLPFGVGNDHFGCPTNDPNWKQLSQVSVFSLGGWVQTSIEVTPSEDMYAIAIGPDCIERPRQVHLYYFFDNLILAEQSQFLLEITPQSGHPCQGDFVLGVPDLDTLSYQWYRDGIALPGETSSKLGNRTPTDGDYQVLLRGPASCKITRPYQHTTPVSYHNYTQFICESDSYNFNGDELRAPGTYFDTLKTASNCDSIIQLELRADDQMPEVRAVKIGAGESYNIGPYHFAEEGKHRAALQSSHGCDSIIIVQLSHYEYFIPNAFSPNNDGFNDRFNIFAKEDIEMIKQFSIFDRWGNMVYRENELMPNETERGWDGLFKGRLSPNGVYVYMAKMIFADGVERSISGSVTLLR